MIFIVLYGLIFRIYSTVFVSISRTKIIMHSLRGLAGKLKISRTYSNEIKYQTNIMCILGRKIEKISKALTFGGQTLAYI